MIDVYTPVIIEKSSGHTPKGGSKTFLDKNTLEYKI